MNILGNRIKKERENLKLTREELAKKLGLSYSAVAMYEQGNREPNKDLILKMCEIFDCSMDYLIGKSEFKIQNNNTPLKNIKKFYEEKTDILLKNKYINEFLKLNLTNIEIENLMQLLTSEDKEAVKNYTSLLNGLFSLLSLNHNENTLDKVKILISKYNQEKLNILTEEMNIYKIEKQKHEEKIKNEHIDQLHSSISGKESATLDENVESLIDYMNKNNLDNVLLIPILGKITAGQPIFADEYLEGYLPVNPNMYGMTSPDDYFYLKVSGESMNLKIHNGDYALIHKQDYAEDGDVVVAIVNGFDEATIKRYKRINEEIVMLEPMSSLPMEPIVINLKETNLRIIGKAIGQFGKF